VFLLQIIGAEFKMLSIAMLTRECAWWTNRFCSLKGSDSKKAIHSRIEHRWCAERDNWWHKESASLERGSL